MGHPQHLGQLGEWWFLAFRGGISLGSVLSSDWPSGPSLGILGLQAEEGARSASSTANDQKQQKRAVCCS